MEKFMAQESQDMVFSNNRTIPCSNRQGRDSQNDHQYPNRIGTIRRRCYTYKNKNQFSTQECGTRSREPISNRLDPLSQSLYPAARYLDLRRFGISKARKQRPVIRRSERASRQRCRDARLLGACIMQDRGWEGISPRSCDATSARCGRCSLENERRRRRDLRRTLKFAYGIAGNSSCKCTPRSGHVRKYVRGHGESEKRQLHATDIRRAIKTNNGLAVVVVVGRVLFERHVKWICEIY
ncbi:hypothetical protein Trydic_g11070 [Trypoxylus dichotomus]